MGLAQIIVIAALLGIVLIVTKANGMWGSSRGARRAKKQTVKEKDLTQKRARTNRFLSYMEDIGENLFLRPNKDKLNRYQYVLDRLKIRFKIMNRNLKPMEVVGIQKSVQLFFFLLALFAIFVLRFRLGIFIFLGMMLPTLWESTQLGKIREEDAKIEKDFPDLYTLLYSRLIKGTSVRIAPTLDEYLISMDAMYGDTGKKEIRKFVKDFRNLIELYADETIALTEMRKIYKSVMVVNFFNVAIQSLRGVDNKDKLLGFKMELQQKKLKQMEENAEKMVQKGKRAVLLIYVILAEFVILSWVAKAGPEIFGKLAGL